MQFFDLNIPYLESDPEIHDKKSKKQIRLQTILKLMELGYTAIAYNRTIKSVMKESDRCTIPPFHPSSFSTFYPCLSNTVSFHRKLLGVAENAPFRQYTRLTVVVEADVQSSVLNSGNPVLKTYDVVAVRPLSQKAFDHACQSAQVDLISIDFGEKVPFRLKLPMVKAAIARGVYFEIAYSSILDGRVRREMIANAKLLVEWTKGKNLIVSSAASSVKELRGPNDVTNLLHLLGLSTERAKATISKNCRLLIADALKKKQFYKEAIRVEMIPASSQTNSKEPWIVDHLDWDPLSSGDGDLCLEDLAKSFAEAGKASQTVKAIDFTSLVDSVPSHAKQSTKDKFFPSGNFLDSVFSSKGLHVREETGKLQKEPAIFSSSLMDQNCKNSEFSEQAMCIDSPTGYSDVNKSRISSVAIMGESKKSDVLEAVLFPVSLDEQELQDHVAVEDMVVSEKIRGTECGEGGSAVEHGYITREAASDKSEDPNLSSMQVSSGQLGVEVLNSTETGVLVKVPSPIIPNSSSDPTSEDDLFTLKQSPPSDTIMLECAHIVMDVDSVAEGNNADILVTGDLQLVDGVPKEQERSELQAGKLMDVDFLAEGANEIGLALHDSHCLKDLPREQVQSDKDYCEIITEKQETHFAGIQVDSSVLGKEDDDISATKCMVNHQELVMERGKQVEDCSEAEHQSLGKRKSGHRKVNRSAFGQTLRFPFKRLVQARFKERGRKSLCKAKKRK